MSHNLAAKGSRLRITSIRTRDVRFPTSLEMDGSDAMNPDPDYSAAYVELITDSDAQLTGCGFVSPSAVATTSKWLRSTR
jgi:hypothetical protein